MMVAAASCLPALRQGVELQPFTTWKVGGLAEWFAEPGERDELIALAAWAQNQGLSLRCIGAGSNLLIADSGLPGLTICNRRLQGAESMQLAAWWKRRPVNHSPPWPARQPGMA